MILEKIYTQEDLNNAVTKSICEMTEVLKCKEEQLEVYKKAYSLLSKAYCDKGDCWERVKCECYEQCMSPGFHGYEITEKLFLQKAREEK